ncbi:MAG TPA: GDYXXLXY domain-containing protein [Chroococcales cyanobacterium]|jgi:uncharacterized membrane-anchored protein
MSANSDSPKPTSIWRFWVPLLFQTALLLTVPAQALYTQLTGKTVVLQTIPMDPYELLRGYSQTLRYDISSQDSLHKLPGWETLPKQQPTEKEKEFSLIEPGTQLYVILEAPKSPTSTELPVAWKPVAVSLKLPAALPPNQVALKGIAEHGFVQYGLETYYIPEDQREQINADLRTARPTDPAQPQQKPPVVMEIKVNSQGDSVPVSIWARVGKASKQQVRNYRF